MDFAGKNQALFHEYDEAGNRHMEYVHERGTYHDVPMGDIIETFKAFYRAEYIVNSTGDLYAEADLDRKNEN